MNFLNLNTVFRPMNVKIQSYVFSFSSHGQKLMIAKAICFLSTKGNSITINSHLDLSLSPSPYHLTPSCWSIINYLHRDVLTNPLAEVLYNVKNGSPFITSKSSSKILSNSSVFVDFQTKCERKCQFSRKFGRIESVCFHNWDSLTNFLTW